MATCCPLVGAELWTSCSRCCRYVHYAQHVCWACAHPSHLQVPTTRHINIGLHEPVADVPAWLDGSPFEVHTDIWQDGHPYPATTSVNMNCALLHTATGGDNLIAMSTCLYNGAMLCAIPNAGTPCASGPCLHGGLCTNAGDSFTCDCTGTGFSGPTCAVDVNVCDTDNGGCATTCLDMVYSPPVCTCATGFTTSDGGATCVPGDCGGCQHSCVVADDGSTSCVCDDGYSTTDGGLTCIADDCTGSSPCQNGGRCTGAAPHAQCDCSGTGYHGATCEDDNNECAVDNGGCAHYCDEVIGGPSVCRCIAGYTTADGGRTCVGSGLCSGDFPHEINGKTCVGIVLNKVYGVAANNVCGNIGGVPVTVDTVAFAQQLAAIAVRVVELVAGCGFAV